jgi:hypothetical protein
MDIIIDPNDIELNNIVLNNINNKGVKNRIVNEFKILYTLFPSVVLRVVSKEISIVVKELIDNKRYTYKFVLRDNFPFEPPRIYFNNYPYIDFLNMKSEFEKKIVWKVKNQNCLCCHSINCRVNWSPAVKIHSIIDEIKNILKFKRSITKGLLAQKIEQKYNIPYNTITSYLF